MEKLTWRHWAFWRYRAAEVAVALVIAVSVIYISTVIQQRTRDMVLPGSWFRVNDLYVPDHKTGSNPEMIYDRVIEESFRAFWVVEVQRQEANGLFSLACQGSGVNDYDPEDYIPRNQVPWDWFIGQKCAVTPGVYRLRATWAMKKPDWPTKKTVRVSNIFTVTP